MKKLSLNEDNWIVKWAFLPQSYIPSQVSLCALFWRSVLFTPLAIGFAITLFGVVVFGICMIVGVLGFILLSLMASVPGGILSLMFGLGVLLLLVEWTLHLRNTDIVAVADRIAEAPVTQAAMDLKRGVCPLIKIERW